jgi:thioredoxin-like negative regulator of GroEL
MVLPVTAANFAALAAAPGVLVIDCSAQWCPPCRTFEPIFAAAAARRRDLVFAALDTDTEPELAAQLDIRAQPTVVFLRDGAVVYKQVGATSAKKFDELLQRVASERA